MTWLNTPNRGINTRSEEGVDTATTAMATLGAGLALVRLLARVPTLAQVPTTAGMISLPIPRATGATAAKTIAGSVTKQMGDPLVNVTIATLTLPVRLLVRGLP